jgi:hypothetical protein
MSLIEKIRKARQSNVTIDGITYIISRPTDMDIATWHGSTDGDILKRFVVGWSGVNEIDLIPGGNPTPAAFETELFIESVADKLTHVETLLSAIVNAYKAHLESKKEIEKKTQATLTP